MSNYLEKLIEWKQYSATEMEKEPKSIDWNQENIEKIPNELGVYWVLDENEKIIDVIRDNDIRKSALTYFKTSNDKKIKKIKYKLFGRLDDAIEFETELHEKFLFITDTFNRRIIDVKNILNQDKLNHIALVIIITALETFLRDRFKELKRKWFEKENEKQYRAKIINVCQAIGKEDDFFRMVFIDGEDTHLIEILYNLLFPDKKNPLIDFQRLDGRLSAEWAYRVFLNIDLKNELNKEVNNTSNRHDWEKLLSYIQLRHKIIHGAKKAVDLNIKKSDVEDALNLVTKLQERIDYLTLRNVFDMW